MRPLDVGRGLGVKIQPGVTEDRVPAPANEKIHYDKNPNGEVIDFRVHKNFRDYPATAISNASRFAPLLGWEKQLGPTIDHCALVQEKLAQFVGVKRAIAGRVQVQIDPSAGGQVLFCVL